MARCKQCGHSLPCDLTGDECDCRECARATKKSEGLSLRTVMLEAAFDPSKCPLHKVMVRKTGAGYRCPSFAECEWELDRYGRPSGKYWEAHKEELDPEGKFWKPTNAPAEEEAPKAIIGDREYVKPRKHMLSRCPIHRKGYGALKVVRSTIRDPKSGADIPIWKCPRFEDECGYGVTFKGHKAFGKAYETLVKDYSKVVDDLPPPPGKGLFPSHVQAVLDSKKAAGDMRFSAKFADDIAKDIGVSSPQVFRELYRQGFDLNAGTGTLAPGQDDGAEEPMGAPEPPKVLRRKKEESVETLYDCLLEGIQDQGYPLGTDTLQKKNPQAYASLPQGDGDLFAFGEFIMFRPHAGGIPLIWGQVEPHRKPIMNDNGEVVKMMDASAEPADWRHYNEFSPAQKKVLGWFPKNERGGSYKGKRRDDWKDDPSGSDFAHDPEKKLPRTQVGGSHQASIAKQAQQMKEPKWGKMPKAEIQKLLPAAIKKAKNDPRYQAVVHRMLAALEKNESSRLKGFVLEALKELNEGTYTRIVVRKEGDGYTVIDQMGGRQLASPQEVRKLGRDRNLWLKFLKGLGAEYVSLEGMGRGGSSSDMPVRKFLDSVVGRPAPGQSIPIVKGQPVPKAEPEAA